MIYWRVYVRHEPGWTGNPAKLGRATCLAGSDWSQGLIAHVWGGHRDALCIDPATGIRDNRKVTTRYNDFANLQWLGLRNAQTPIFNPAEPGRWDCVESQVAVNTPGKADGKFRPWIEGRLEAERTDLDWHGRWQDYGIDAVFLENYWNDGAVKREARWFDDFAVSTHPIGPVTATVAPELERTMTAVGKWQAQAASDPEGKDVMWTSRTLPGGVTRVRIGAAQGSFAGNRRLVAGGTYWLRVRSRPEAGDWTGWSESHAPFRTAGQLCERDARASWLRLQ